MEYERVLIVHGEKEIIQIFPYSLPGHLKQSFTLQGEASAYFKLDIKVKLPIKIYSFLHIL